MVFRRHMPSTETHAAARSGARPLSAGAANSLSVASWLVPGLGYFLLRRWVRGVLVLVCILAMFFLGLAMQGQLLGVNSKNLLDVLGWIGDICNGLPYLITCAAGGGTGNLYTVTGDYGSMFLIASGLLNILAAADVRDVALGRKP